MNIKIFTQTKQQIEAELQAFENKTEKHFNEIEEINKMYNQEYVNNKSSDLYKKYNQLTVDTNNHIKAIYGELVTSSKNIITTFFAMPINSDLKATLDLIEKSDLTAYELYQYMKALEAKPFVLRYLKNNIDRYALLDATETFNSEELREFKKMLDNLQGIKTLDEYIFKLNELTSDFNINVDVVIQNIIQKYKGKYTTADEISFNINKKLLYSYIDEVKELLDNLNALSTIE